MLEGVLGGKPGQARVVGDGLSQGTLAFVSPWGEVEPTSSLSFVPLGLQPQLSHCADGGTEVWGATPQCGVLPRELYSLGPLLPGDLG